jgi:hypothetical protein
MHGTFHLFFRLQWLLDIQSLLLSFDKKGLSEAMEDLRQENTIKFALVAMGLMEIILGYQIEEKYALEIKQNRKIRKLITLSEEAIEGNCSFGVDIRSENRFKKMIRNHKVQYYAGGLRGLIKSITSRNVRPKNWEYFAFPDQVFFLNHLFSRIISLFLKMKKKH